MTEGQRKLKKDFHLPETRCGHFVRAEMKALWKVQLDMLELFDGICRRNGLKYYMIGGSLIGAMRHKGYIPWDDDIDVVMFRADYEKLKMVLPGELEYPYFVQTAETDPEYWEPYLKIRNSNTTFIEGFAISRGHCFNMGVFIDVFPLDGMPMSDADKKSTLRVFSFWHKVLRNLYRRRFMTRVADRLKAWASYAFCVLIGVKRVGRMVERCYAKYKVVPHGECIAMPFNVGYDDPRRIWRVDLFSETMEVPFEYLTVMVPKRYDEILTTQFGDWHKMVKGGANHSALVVDVNRPFVDVLAERFGYDRKLLRKRWRVWEKDVC